MMDRQLKPKQIIAKKMKMPCPGKKVEMASFFFLIVLLTLIFSLQAERYDVRPDILPDVILSPMEAEKLSILLDTKEIRIMTDVSPDNRMVLMMTENVNGSEFYFQNMDTLETIPVSEKNSKYISDEKMNGFDIGFRWISDRELMTVSLGKDDVLKKVIFDIKTGDVKIFPIPVVSLKGAVLNLSIKGTKVLLAREKHSDEKDPEVESSRGLIEILPADRSFTLSSNDLAGKGIMDGGVPVARKAVDLFAVDLKDGSEFFLTAWPEGIAVTGVAWSPGDDGCAIVFGMETSWRRDGSVTIESPETVDGLGLYPPEKNPFISSNVFEIFRFDEGEVEHEKVRSVSHAPGLFKNVIWSTDGKILMVEVAEPSILSGRKYPVYSHSSASRFQFFNRDGDCFHELSRSQISASKGAIYAFISPLEVLLCVPDGLTFSLYLYNLENESLRRLPVPDGKIRQMKPFPLDRKVLCLFDSFHQPPETFTMEIQSKTIRQISNVNLLPFTANRIRADKLSFKLSSGVTREGYLIQPEDAPFPPQNVPICVWQAGGPTSDMTNGWSSRPENALNILPNFGIATLMVPLPGRVGFGKKFLNALPDGAHFGQIDIDEQMEISMQLIQRGYTSRSNIGIYGMSYGGYFTAQTLTTYPDFYAAANMQFSLLNLFHEWEQGYMGYISYLMGCTPENYDEYDKDSPLQRAQNIRTPTMIFTGSEDFLPSEFSLEFNDVINQTGHTVSDVYYFHEEGHGLKRRNARFIASQAIIQWFSRHLKP